MVKKKSWHEKLRTQARDHNTTLYHILNTFSKADMMNKAHVKKLLLANHTEIETQVKKIPMEKVATDALLRNNSCTVRNLVGNYIVDALSSRS